MSLPLSPVSTALSFRSAEVWLSFFKTRMSWCQWNRVGQEAAICSHTFSTFWEFTFRGEVTLLWATVWQVWRMTARSKSPRWHNIWGTVFGEGVVLILWGSLREWSNWTAELVFCNFSFQGDGIILAIRRESFESHRSESNPGCTSYWTHTLEQVIQPLRKDNENGPYLTCLLWELNTVMYEKGLA